MIEYRLFKGADVEMTGGEALAAQLCLEGVETVFGVPGIQLDWAMDGLARHSRRLRFLAARHEQGAAYMADGYARTGTRPGVFMVVPGPGLLNAGAALSTAFACSSPVLALVGQIPSHHIGSGRGLLHEIRGQSEIVASLTKWSSMATAPQDIPRLVHEALAQVRSGRPRPVALELPPDVLSARADISLDERPAADGRAVPDAGAIAKAADHLAPAARPVIVAGSGVLAAGASAELEALAEVLEAPVVMTSNGRGALSERHRLACNSLVGRSLIAASDAVLVVGSRFMTSAGTRMRTPEGAPVILLDADPDTFDEEPAPSVAVLGDARLGLAALGEALAGGATRPRRDDEIAAARTVAERQVRAIEPQRSFARALRAALPDDGILVNELTQVGYVARVAYPVYAPRTFLTPGYQGTLGYGFPTALGAKVANPERAVVSITGDGGFGWCCSELATASLHRISVVTVVFNDGAFGNVRRTQKEEFAGRYIGSDLASPDFVALAASFGIAGARVGEPSELTQVLGEAIAANEPFLIEVPVGEMPSGWHLIVDQPPTALATGR